MTAKRVLSVLQKYVLLQLIWLNELVNSLIHWVFGRAYRVVSAHNRLTNRLEDLRIQLIAKERR